MSTFTPARVGMSLDEFIELGNQQPFELINGEEQPKLPNVAGHNEVAQALFLALHLYAAPESLGVAVIEGTFILPDSYDSNGVTGSRIPAVMFYAGDRLATHDLGFRPSAPQSHCSCSRPGKPGCLQR